jgi:uncharacterized protein YggU (UPF0235/DUF167 family)
VRAPAVDGAANAALIAFLANALAVVQSAIVIEGGAGSPVKRLTIDDADPERLAHLMGG